jgi:chromosome segregation ATPase
VLAELEAELKGIKEQVKEDEAHVDALETGDTFVPTLKKKKTSQSGKKRKNSLGDKKGLSKRRRPNADSEDSDEDFFDDSSETDSDEDSEEEDTEEDQDNGEDDEDEDMNEVTIDDLREKITLGKASIKRTRERLNAARATKKAAADAISSLEKSISKLQKEKNAFCSLKRSEVSHTSFSRVCVTDTSKLQFSRDVLKEDFRVGLKDLDGNFFNTFLGFRSIH